MKVKLIFWGNETVNLNEVGLMYDLKLARYYRRVSTNLYEYAHIKQEDIKALYHEMNMKADVIVLLTMEALNEERIEIIKDLSTKYLNKFYILMKEKGEGALLEAHSLKDVYNYVPDVSVKELVHIFPVVIEQFIKDRERLSYKVKGSTLIMGYEQISRGMGELVKEIFKNWRHVYTFPCITLNLYSKDEGDLVKITQLEDVFCDYVGEETKFILNWYKHAKAGEEIYFLAEGRI